MGRLDAAPVAGEGAHAASLAALHLVGPARLRWLLSHGPAPEVWAALVAGVLDAAAPVDRELVDRWHREAARCPELPAEMAGRLGRLGVDTLLGAAVPSPLREDVDAPPLVLRSGADVPPGPRVAVVGTRTASPYGRRVAEELGQGLSEAGVGVVSGLALGIDAAAHTGALRGPTPVVAVIGAGHDRPCPARNRALAAEVARRGTVLSEVPPGVASAPWRYPVRNRLIAALADVVVVVESASSGGSMSTVAEALDRDRAVMAVPGPVGRRTSAGCHDLLRDGAELCGGVQDVLSLLDLVGVATGRDQAPVAAPDVPARGSGPALSARAADVVDELAAGPLPLDAVMARLGTDLAATSAVVAELQQLGLVSARGGWLELTATPVAGPDPATAVRAQRDHDGASRSD